MRAISPPAVLPLVLTGTALLSACGAERAVRIELELAHAEGDTVCVVAHGAGELVFAAPYEIAALPEGERSLTFVAGERVHDTLVVTARTARDGRILSRASAEVRFADEGVVRRTLRPRHCAERAPSGLGALPGGTFAALSPDPRVLASDLDGDGRDELLALGADGALLVLDAEQRDAGSRRATELRAPDGALTATGDLDGDCRLEVVAAAPVGALVVLGESGASPSPLGEAANDVAIGLRTSRGGPGLAIASDTGLTLTPWDEDVPTTLATGAFTRVVAGDVTGDGRDDLVAVGEAGTRVLIATDAAFRDEPGALPASIAASLGPITLGDLDGDGTLDLASASGNALRIALNRGDGLLEDRTGPTAPMLEAEVRRLASGDLDGDCVEEIVALDAAGRASVWSHDARGSWIAREDVPDTVAVDLALLDADGDGALELALLDATGRVTLWRP